MTREAKSEKKVPVRTCCGCMRKFPKASLVRISCDADGNLSVDPKRTFGGRGAYICRNQDCLMLAVTSGRLKRTLRYAGGLGNIDEIQRSLS